MNNELGGGVGGGGDDADDDDETMMVDGAGDGGRVYRLSDYLTSKSRQLRDISHMGIVHLIANISGVGQTSRFHVTSLVVAACRP